MEYDFVYFPASPVVCEEPTPTSGVTVVQPHNTTVSSVIVYQCQQPGFAPSQIFSIWFTISLEHSVDAVG